MPRKKKPKPPSAAYPTGTPTPQATKVPTGLPYGQHQELERAQQAMPLPGVAPGGGVSSPAPPPGPPPGPVSPEAAMAAAAGHNFSPVDMYAPGGGEPITSGLPIGAGPGPEAIRRSPTTADTLQMIASMTGDQTFQTLADRARLQAS